MVILCLIFVVFLVNNLTEHFQEDRIHKYIIPFFKHPILSLLDVQKWYSKVILTMGPYTKSIEIKLIW